MNDSSVRVRFAPSPTGYLHIGGARTALYNWLFARKHKGAFILRIEDTDEARSTEESVGAILESMKWLGLDWDEGPRVVSDKKVESGVITQFTTGGDYHPYFQMRAHQEGVYAKYAEQLLTEGKAYRCFCSPEEVEEMRKAAQAAKKVPKYDGRCRKLTSEQIKQKEAEGKKYVIRLKVPEEGKTIFDDIVRGRVEFDNYMLDDFVLVKTSGVPTYNFAVVVDDVRMKITHIIRGDDHLSNTPKQIHIYNALDWQTPVFAHISMILGSDGSRLSKRHGHTSVLEYRNDGFLPAAVVNYLALLGWSTEDSQQLFELDDLMEKFSLERCAKNPAVFDPQKLLWMNGEYIRKTGGDKLPDVFFQWAKETGISEKIKDWDKSLLSKILTAEFEKVKLLRDVPDLVDFFFTDNVEYKSEAVEKVLKKPEARQVLEEALKVFGNRKSLPSTEGGKLPDAGDIELITRDIAETLHQKYGLIVKAGQIFHPIRVAISGRTTGPSLFHAMEWLGMEQVTKRITVCLEKCFK
ncbi:MAG: glutamate--tRNA ligase [Elusimicrobiota bacterium]